jgi:dethiobiotin synthetase
MHRGFFITGTDTGIGKTHVSCSLLTALGRHGLKTAAMKPVASGCQQTAAGWRNDDALQLLQAANIRLRYDDVNPYALPAAIAPHLAAREAGVNIDLDVLQQRFDSLARQADMTIVEGVGGWCVPLNDTQSTVDLAQRLGLPLIIVVGIRLGCINHAQLTVNAINCAAGNPAVAGWIANIIDPETLRIPDIITTLRRVLDVPFLGTLTYRQNAETRPVSQQAGFPGLDKLL